MRNRFQTFVASRYLMAQPLHVSWLALIISLIALAACGILLLVAHYVFPEVKPLPGEAFDPTHSYLMIAGWVSLGVGLLTLYVFGVRVLFTFYTTVSVVGVSIGGAALVTVLSVMNGFEGHLRHKILGSNAHIQVGKEDGDFTEWEDVGERVSHIRGVVAWTPFATSEVVVAANSNYHNVVIKGIDVRSAIKVTDLQRYLVDKDGLDNLEPLIREPEPEESPPPSPRDPSQPVLDPAPDDLPEGGDPIDYSGDPAPAGASDDRRAPGGRTTGDGLAPALAPPDFGGDARVILDDGPAVDPVPSDFADGEPVDDDVPRDFSGRSPPSRPTTGTSRIATLPGVLIGRELQNTIHLLKNQEVRLVSPLADPMNPDANGTPIPFNRDYRVAGEFFTGMYEYDLKLVYVSLDSLQRFLRLGDAVDGIEVRISSPDDVDAVVKKMARELGPSYRVQGWRELNRQLFSALKLEKIAMFIILAIIILVASFSIVGNLIMIVVEKGQQIAMFKTLGASDVEVVVLFVIQGTLIGVVGSALGVVIGLGLCVFLAVVGFPIPAEVYYMSRLPVEVDYLTVAVIFAAGVVISFLATIYPAILAAQLRPAVGLKKF